MSIGRVLGVPRLGPKEQVLISPTGTLTVVGTGPIGTGRQQRSLLTRATGKSYQELTFACDPMAAI